MTIVGSGGEGECIECKLESITRVVYSSSVVVYRSR